MKKKRFQHSICFSSVEDMPEAKGSVAFITDSAKVFKDDIDIAPITLSDGTQYVPWGGDNMMPYNILNMIENKHFAVLALVARWLKHPLQRFVKTPCDRVPFAKRVVIPKMEIVCINLKF